MTLIRGHGERERGGRERLQQRSDMSVTLLRPCWPFDRVCFGERGIGSASAGRDTGLLKLPPGVVSSLSLRFFACGIRYWSL